MLYSRTKKIRLIFIICWVLLAYIIAALVWWFIALSNLNHQMASYKRLDINKDDPAYVQLIQTIDDAEKRKSAQYIGEGSIFLLLILGGAFYIFRLIRLQFKSTQQQQNFLMAITHELKTPIAITKLNLETLQKRKLEEPQQQRLIQNTIQETNRLNTLCTNMLLVSQIESGNYAITKHKINFSNLVNECVHDFEIRFPTKKIETTIEPDIYILADWLLLQMSINNLIDNAIKYSPKETIIKIELTIFNNAVTCIIKDQGRGIINSEKKKIFDKYYRIGNEATKSAKGTGLGLYLTNKIIQQHNATILVTDNDPCGCIFTIHFKKAFIK